MAKCPPETKFHREWRQEEKKKEAYVRIDYKAQSNPRLKEKLNEIKERYKRV